MKLKDLLQGIYQGQIPASFENFDVLYLSSDSRKISPGSLFVALRGTQKDGAEFISDAIKAGAKVIIKDHDQSTSFQNQSICILTVDDPKEALLEISKRFYRDPSKKVKTIAVTGTNGKTTITYLLESILNASGKKCGVIGTINYRIAGKTLPSGNTTPGIIDSQDYLAQLVSENIPYCVMEVSSHALDQGRVDHVDFNSAIFTNLTGDHLDYHKDMESYFLAKAKLFQRLSPLASAIVNQNDPYGERLLKMTQARVVSYGINNAQIQAKNICLGLEGSEFLITYDQKEIALKTKLIGRHNVYNILASVAEALQQDIDSKDIQRGIEALQNVPGRLERVSCGQDFSVFVDYAHTEDALFNVLSILKSVAPSKIILVFGCGGDRDKTKRPKMGKIACEMADVSIITSDNPRSEDPQSIAQDILAGYQNKEAEIILDRQKAIKKALSIAKRGDIVLIAGKGHEDYQIFKDKKIFFDDRRVVRDHFGC